LGESLSRNSGIVGDRFHGVGGSFAGSTFGSL